MGFLSAWDATERVDVSDLVGDLPGTWWIDVKRCLSHGEADAVMRQLMGSTMHLGDPTAKGAVPVQTSLTVDAVVDHQAILVAKSIVAWNLTDQNDLPLPTAPFEELERSLALLPSPVYDRVAKVVVEANTETAGDSSTFSAEGGGSDTVGIDYRPDSREILV